MPQYLAEVITASWLATYFEVSVAESGSISYAWPSPNHMWLDVLRPKPPCSPSIATRLPDGAGDAGPRYWWKSITSPAPESPCELQQFTPLWALTSRDGSCALTEEAIRPVSSRLHSPQPSLNGIQATMDVQDWCSRTISCSSDSNCARQSAGIGPVLAAGMSCQTSRPSRSAQ